MNFDTALAAFVAHAQNVVNAYFEENFPSLTRPKLSAQDKGQKYVRIVSEDQCGTSRSCYCFIRREDGAVLFPESWKRPSTKTPRGNIFKPETLTACCGPHGVARLR